MKIFPLLLLVCVVGLVAGCDSMSSRVQDRFTTVQPHTRIFAANEKVVFEAAQQAVKDSGLLVGRKSFGEGLVEGYAPIRGGDAAVDTRQTTIEVRLFDTGVDETRVELLVWNKTEGGFPGGVSEEALKEHGLYDSYFTVLQQILEQSGALKTTAKP